jgi:hypothetical protein
MVCEAEQLIVIDDFAAKNLESEVNASYQVHKAARDLLELCAVNRDMLKELGLGQSPSYNFCCNVVHNWARYRKISNSIKLNNLTKSN